MLSTLVLLLVLVVTLGTVSVARRELKSLRREVDEFVVGVEQRTRTEESHDAEVADASIVSEEVGTLLDEAFQAEHHNLAVLALNEFTGRAGLARSKALSFAKGLSRIGLLSGAGGAFALAALGGFEGQALVYAGASVAVGMVSSFSCHALSGKIRQLAKRYGELTDTVAKQVDRHFKEEPS